MKGAERAALMEGAMHQRLPCVDAVAARTITAVGCLLPTGGGGRPRRIGDGHTDAHVAMKPAQVVRFIAVRGADAPHTEQASLAAVIDAALVPSGCRHSGGVGTRAHVTCIAPCTT